jgi:membrane associated rhomboid family serine protease
MGFQDRDYYRESSSSIYVTSMVVKLIIVNGLVFLAEILFDHYRDAAGRNYVASLLGVHADTIVNPAYWWQFLTAGFVHDPKYLNHILFNMLGLYCFGMPLEERYGRKDFLRFYLIAVVLGFIVWSASHRFLTPTDPRVLCFGASGGVTAVTLLFCLLYPRATILASFLFPIPAWIMGIIIIVSNLFGSSTGVAYDVHLVGAAFAISYWYFGWNFGRLRGLDGLQRLFGAPQKWFKPRPPLKVHDPEHYYEDLDAEADRLLEKVAKDGLSSLSNEERRTLEDYSRRTRQKLR